jgi:hypothetical protein
MNEDHAITDAVTDRPARVANISWSQHLRRNKFAIDASKKMPIWPRQGSTAMVKDIGVVNMGG